MFHARCALFGRAAIGSGVIQLFSKKKKRSAVNSSIKGEEIIRQKHHWHFSTAGEKSHTNKDGTYTQIAIIP